MLSSDENSGLFAFVIGVIIVVFTGIVLSIVVDWRFRFSSSLSALEAEIRKNESDLERLRASHLQSSCDLWELEPGRGPAVAALASFRKNRAEMERRKAALYAERDKLSRSIPALEEEFANYRAKYRAMLRDAAVGESVGDLTTLSGRGYGGVFIVRVTDADLEIRHTHGFARIAASDLAPAWRNRFHWDEEVGMDRKDR